MTYKIGIVVADGVRTSEVSGPVEVFALAKGHERLKDTQVLLIGVSDRATVRTDEGLTLTVDVTLASAPSVDVLLVPGSYDVTPLMENAALNAYIQQQAEAAEWVGSFCAGAFVLSNAGVLDGKQATTWFGGEDSLQKQFPAVQVVKDRPVVVDRRRITSNAGMVSYQAALVLLGQLTDVETAKGVYLALNMGRLSSWEQIEATILEAAAIAAP